MSDDKQFRKPDPVRQTWFPCFLLSLLASVVLSVQPISAHSPETQQHDGHMSHETMMPDGTVSLPVDPDAAKFVGIVENAGEMLPLDTAFWDENGKELTLGQIIDRPVILLPAFYTCPRSCSILISNLATALNHVDGIPGKDFRVITLGFDSDETPADAKQAKANYIPLLPKDFPKTEWIFLTGTQAAVMRVTDAMGYHFKRTGLHTFVQPNALVAVSGKGVVIRYVYGPSFLGPDIAMALTEAAKGVPAISVKRILSFCFNYDPASNRYVFQTLKITAIAIFFLLGAFIIFVLRRKKSDRKHVRDSMPHPLQGDRDRD